MENTIDRIHKCLTEYTAHNYYLFYRTRQEHDKGSSFDEWLQIMYGSGDTPKNICLDRLKISRYNEYADMIKKYNGFLENGKVFVLDKNEKHIYFLYNSDKVTANIYSHYNPFNFDCVEASVPAKWFNREVISERYIISLDEDYLIKELHKL